MSRRGEKIERPKPPGEEDEEEEEVEDNQVDPANDYIGIFVCPKRLDQLQYTPSPLVQQKRKDLMIRGVRIQNIAYYQRSCRWTPNNVFFFFWFCLRHKEKSRCQGKKKTVMTMRGVRWTSKFTRIRR